MYRYYFSGLIVALTSFSYLKANIQDTNLADAQAQAKLEIVPVQVIEATDAQLSATENGVSVILTEPKEEKKEGFKVTVLGDVSKYSLNAISKDDPFVLIPLTKIEGTDKQWLFTAEPGTYGIKVIYVSDDFIKEEIYKVVIESRGPPVDEPNDPVDPPQGDFTKLLQLAKDTVPDDPLTIKKLSDMYKQASDEKWTKEQVVDAREKILLYVDDPLGDIDWSKYVKAIGTELNNVPYHEGLSALSKFLSEM